MTYLQLVEALLDNNWTASITGRDNDVPKPDIVLEKSVTKEDLRTKDVIKIADAGDTEFEPLGFNWTHERVEATVVAECRSADRRESGTKVDGRVRVFGERDSTPPYDAERHGGLTGEVRRIIKDNRIRTAEFNLLNPSTVQDNSDLAGKNYYRSDVVIGLTDAASEIDTST